MQDITLSETQKAQLKELGRLLGRDPIWVLRNLIESLLQSEGWETEPSKFHLNQPHEVTPSRKTE